MSTNAEIAERLFPEAIPAGDMADRHYKIVNLKAHNFLRLKAVDITPGDNPVIEITGKNGAGKSSVLKAIWSVFANREVSKGIPSPVRSGEESGSVSVDLGDMTITRSWTGTDTYLRIENKNGAVYRSPQALLDKLKTSLSFDPLAFTRMDKKEQRATLLKVLGVDLDSMEREREGYFNARTEANREVKNLTAQMQPYQMLPVNLPRDQISAGDLINRIREAEQNNQKIAQVDREITKKEQEIIDFERKLQQIKADLEVAINTRDGMKEISVSDMEKQLSNIEELNKQIQKKQALDGIVTRLNAVSKKSDELTEKIEFIDRMKKESLKSADLPMPDISISPDGILYRDIPLSQCSAAEQVRVSVAMGAALNPGLRVLLIQDGSLLDSSSRKIIEDLAREQDMQVWIETVDETGSSGILIEDGEIV
jgi:DNA repair exonuclease SbcCD ATPase subunit